MPASDLPAEILQAIRQSPMEAGAIAASLAAIWPALSGEEQAEIVRLGPSFAQHLVQIACVSTFARHLLQRHPDWLPHLARREGHALMPVGAVPVDAFLAGLREYRNAHMVEIIWQDRQPGEHYPETVAALSALAETCLQHAYDYGVQTLRQRHGIPRNKNGLEVPFTILGMGKLGGRELNLSSDIDLIFCYGEGGETDGPGTIDNSAYFLRLGRWLIQALDQRTADGFCFRVDMRLRPFGDAGPLCISAAAMEQYYQVHGRGWERYAFIKARPVAGDVAFGQSLLDTLRPFVYRRYLDYTALTGLREVKALMDAEQAGSGNDIKKGRGGIREIEFVCQSLQIIHGGRQPALRSTNTLDTLAAIAHAELLPADDIGLLRHAYLFLRNVEHCLQMVDDQQTQQLPKSETEWQRLTCAMGFMDVATLRATLDELRLQTHAIFQRTLALKPTAHSPAEDNANRLWQLAQTGAMETTLGDLLQVLHFAAPETAWTGLWRFAHSRDVASRLSTEGRQRLNRLLPLILDLCSTQPDTDALLQRFLALIEAILGRANYLALLAENPPYLVRIARLLHSPWLAQELARFPILLDDVLSDTPVSPEHWPQTLAAQLQLAPDMEERMDALRRFKNAEVLRLAAVFWTRQMPVETLLPQLSGLAQLTLQTALGWAEAEMQRRHGNVRTGNGQVARFTVIAFGKLGGQEMGFASDLDLVYLYDAPLDAESDGHVPIPAPTWFARLGQRLIHILSTLTRAGLLYQIDMRLRPSGQSGPLVTTLDAFSRYQRESAWTWEHQALTRARWVAGDTELGARFAALRTEILGRPRDPGQLRKDIRSMRQRIYQSKSIARDTFHLKLSPGGLTDIEFLVQFAMLGACSQQPVLCQGTGTAAGIAALTRVGIWSTEQGVALGQAWHLYREMENRRWLGLQEPVVRAAEFPDWDTLQAAAHGVRKIWQELIGSYTD
ncbi:bifunctional [glutamate--ammonia ligase]-adenylyl-L-tyrosine phosphorylase/[glutamate--ammonia-ligase] adenylyltransferase [Acidithiobacillus ferrooxidans]|uniref:bifunctional [glutamate--ammonia ligase]-adenylyl-L-tyrosine phosphorylase/[glutamate--ammonia-ligase] adenylyltransferase n=1 Tax=Acidithiobacillus ferrooxidans TaxID=920 RepID=UPI0013D4693D|nr:bifunctional [glutamate--ammonia ligase]-adenylyl-L-tyrosine phosphorylase/[glutamate--ammonia-ligase] adenylyltransferase [Acidithiobacillus ferrooxidans]MCR2829440.1 bifunctional [glutamate--ammonia ligase]-adenylyl-L-tyrosine phosphorylase/[glutamate--ammonia-ligase] adenylyltransferase [Acidithiobacillus ferrooxidans]